MNFSLTALAAMVFLHLVTPLVLWAFLSKLTGGMPARRRVCLVAALAMAPVLVGMILVVLYRRLPDRPDALYALAPVVLILLLAALSWRQIKCVPSALADLGRSIRARLVLARCGLLTWVLGGLVIANMAHVVHTSFSLTLLDTDALEYAALGRHIERKQSLKFYPMMAADDKTGFYTPCTHPSTYPALMAWHYLIQKDSWNFGYGRLLGLWAMLSMTASLLFLTREESLFHSLASVLSMQAVGALLHEFSNGTIDPLFLAPFLGALAVIVEAAHQPGWRQALLAGLLMGCTASVHSIGVYLLLVLAATVFLITRAPLSRRLGLTALTATTGFALAADTYLRNFRLRGRPLGDDVAVWELPVVSFQEFMREERQLVSMTDRLLNGVLRMWGYPEHYSLLPWVFVLLLLPCLLRLRCWREWPIWFRAALTVAGIYFAGVMLSWLVGLDLLIKNFRYHFPIILMMAAALAFLLPGGDLALIRLNLPRVRKSLKNWSGIWLRPISKTLLVLLLLWLSSLDYHQDWGSLIERVKLPKDSRLAQASDYGALVMLRAFEEDAQNEPTARLLSFSTNYPAFYSKRPILSELDPRMTPMYLAKSRSEALDFLKEEGVTHILATPYSWPTFDHTIAKRLFDDESKCYIIAERDGWRLGRLNFRP